MNILLRAFFVTTSMVTLFAATPMRIAAKPTVIKTVNSVLSPKFSAITVQGAELSNQKLVGKGYIVNFFGSWCPFCRGEIPGMVALQEKYEKMGFTFIGMAYKDNEKSMPDFIWEHSINYPIIMADKSIIESFSPHISGGVSSVPLLFAVGRNGKLLSVVHGAQSRDEFEKIILQTLQRPAKP